MSPQKTLSRQSSADTILACNKLAPAGEAIRLDTSVSTKSYYIGGVQVHFPFAPYPSQLGMMNHMIGALNKGKNTMIESPTGSGKSLALLCAVLAWRRSLIAKQKKLAKQVERIVMNFGKHNPLLLRDKFGNTDHPSDTVEPDEKLSSNDKTPVDVKQEPDSPKKSVNSEDPEDDSKTSIGLLLAKALFYREQTLTYILDMAKSRKLEGVSEEDIAVLQEVKDSGIRATHTPKVYFGSRTHKQVSQLVDELRRKTPYRLQTAVLGSRAQTCIYSKREKIGSESVEDMCRSLRDDEKCDPHTNFRRILSHKTIVRGGELEIWDLEDLVKLGRKTNACPYYASREMAINAELIFCPYNYILDPTVRDAAGIELANSVVIFDEAHNIENAARDAASFEVTDKALGILAFECAKMIENRILISSHNSIKNVAETLANWLQQEDNVYEYIDYEMQTSVWPKPDWPVEQLLKDLMLTPDVVQNLKIAYSVIDDYIRKLRKDKNDGPHLKWLEFDDMDPENENLARPNIRPMRHLSSSSMRIVDGLIRMLSISWPGSKFANDYRIAIMRCPNPEARSDFQSIIRSKWKKRLSSIPRNIPLQLNTLAFWCMNPGVIFQKISDLSWSVVLTSGTLSPLESYASELQVDFASTLEASHVIHPDRFCALSVQCGPSGAPMEAKYKTTDQLSFQDDMGEAIVSITKKCPDGMLVFAPSYALLNKLFARWELTGVLAEINVHKEVFIEPQGGSSEFDKLLKAFRKYLYKSENIGQPSARGAIIFAVYRGKVSEGIDFSDYFCRTVVNIGIPYPAFKDVQVILKREYNDAHSVPKPGSSRQLLNGSKWYNIQAFRAINQALGRCLRHKNDWGAIIMLESRFAHPWNISQLSKWVRGSLQVYYTLGEAQQYLEKFYQERIQDDLNEAVDGDVVTLELVDDK
ncbi:hypothetical protein LPJ55_004561 [Coemansia sp. RSA 990]|nr:hypothetical protein LPJ55_004561 [Coemansia sp. RSA 990]